MKLQALKKSDGKIWLVAGDIDLAKEAGDLVIELPSGWEPPNKKFRDCWRESGGEIIVDLPLARTQKLNEVRAERYKKLLETDAQWVEKSSKGESLTALGVKKQALRDLPEAVALELDAISDVDDLADYEPEWP